MYWGDSWEWKVFASTFQYDPEQLSSHRPATSRKVQWQSLTYRCMGQKWDWHRPRSDPGSLLVAWEFFWKTLDVEVRERRPVLQGAPNGYRKTLQKIRSWLQSHLNIDAMMERGSEYLIMWVTFQRLQRGIDTDWAREVDVLLPGTGRKRDVKGRFWIWVKTKYSEIPGAIEFTGN